MFDPVRELSASCPRDPTISRDPRLSQTTNRGSTDDEKSPMIIGVFPLTWGFSVVGPTGLEPVTSCVSRNQAVISSSVVKCQGVSLSDEFGPVTRAFTDPWE